MSRESEDTGPQGFWPHAPIHQLSEHGAYFVTAGTYQKEHHFRGATRLGVLQRGILRLTKDAGWRIEARAVFSNHYHFVAQAPRDQSDGQSLQALHERTSRWVNRLDTTPGRRVWHNYWDTHLSFERSYLARVRYVHENPVHHGLIPDASLYPYCSAAWFERTASPAWQRTIRSFKIDKLNVADEFDAHTDW
jgi:putative transposase